MKQALSSDKPTRVRGQFRAITLGIGGSALAMACSFGQIDGDPEIRNIDPTPSTEVGQPGDDTTDPVDGAGSGGVDPTGPSNPNPTTDPSAVPYDPDADPFTTTIGLQVRSILETNCGSCHSNGLNLGDMNYILDYNELVKNGRIIPGNKEDSLLFTRMQQQSMPPAAIRSPRPSFSDIDLLGEFIDQLETLEQCDSLEFMSMDEQIQAMASDIRTLEATDQPFTRYLTVTYNSNAGGCGRELQRQRFALFKGINSVSTNPQITKPEAIDANELIYRIDIRDYNWDREIDLEDNQSVDFVDAWEAIVATSAPFAVEFIGEDADQLKLDAATLIPFMPVNAFIQFTEEDDLYYALIGARANLFDFERDVLQIDIQDDIDNDRLMRAGFSDSGVSKQDRVLNRFANGLAAGQSYWISFDFDGGNGNGLVGDVSNGFEINVANESIYADPIDFAFAGGEAIFSLPNGLQGYYVAAANGARLAKAPVGVVIDPAQNNGEVVNGASCHTCHNAGMITFKDTVRDYVLANRVEFDNETFEDVMNQYPAPAVFQAQMDRDSAMHQRAVIEAGLPPASPDPITRTYLDFQLGNLNLAKAAGELGVTPDELLQNARLLDPRLSANLTVEGGYVNREVFADAFTDAICILQAVSENTPANCQ